MAIPNGHFRKLGSASLLINCKCNQRELLTFCKTISIWPTGPSKGFRNSKWAVEIGNMSDIRLDVCWILLIIGSKWFKNCLSGVWKRLKNWRKVNRMMGSSRVAWKGLFWNVFRKYDDLRPQKLGSKRIQTVEISRSFICFVKTAIFWIYLIAQAVTIESFNQCSDDSVPILSAAPRLLAKCRVQAHANWQCPYDELRVQHRLATTPLRLQDLSRARCRSCSGHVRAWVGQDETQLVSKIGRSRQVWAALTLATLRKQHIVLTLPLNSLVQLRPFLAARPLPHSDTRPRRNGKRRASKSMGPVGMLLAPQTWQTWQTESEFRIVRMELAKVT